MLDILPAHKITLFCLISYIFLAGVHIQRRRESSETSTDGQERPGHAETRDATEIPREPDVGSGQGLVSNKMEGDDSGIK